MTISEWFDQEFLIDPDPELEVNRSIEFTDDFSDARSFYPGLRTVGYPGSITSCSPQLIFKNRKERISAIPVFRAPVSFEGFVAWHTGNPRWLHPWICHGSLTGETGYFQVCPAVLHRQVKQKRSSGQIAGKDNFQVWISRNSNSGE